MVPSLNLPLSSILTPQARSRLIGRSTLRTLFNRVFFGQSLSNALVRHDELRNLMIQERVDFRNLLGNVFLVLLARLQARIQGRQQQDRRDSS